MNSPDPRSLNRRSFIVKGVAVAGSWASGRAFAQAMLPKVGVPDLFYDQDAATSGHKFYPRFEEALARNGWVAGKNVAIEYRFLAAEDRPLTDAVAKVIALEPKVIFASSAPMLKATLSLTQTIPVVAQDMTTDPVAAGYAQSYARPGKNMTGVFLDAPEIGGKWIEILQSLIPRLSRVSVLWDPRPGSSHLNAVKEAASKRGVKLYVVEVRTKRDIQSAFPGIRARSQALVVLPSPILVDYSKLLADLALKHKVPAISPFRLFVDMGGAIAYGANLQEMIERNAVMVAKILAGTKRGDIPIERPTKFDFFFNMKTMRALDLKVPESLLLGAEMIGK